MVMTWSLYLTWHWIRIYRVVTDGQTDGQTEFPLLIRALSSTCRYSCRA